MTRRVEGSRPGPDVPLEAQLHGQDQGGLVDSAGLAEVGGGGGDSPAPGLVPVEVAINLRGGEGGGPGAEHGHTVPDQHDSKPLPQVAHRLAALAPHVPGQLPSQGGASFIDFIRNHPSQPCL